MIQPLKWTRDYQVKSFGCLPLDCELLQFKEGLNLMFLACSRVLGT